MVQNLFPIPWTLDLPLFVLTTLGKFCVLLHFTIFEAVFSASQDRGKSSFLPESGVTLFVACALGGPFPHVQPCISNLICCALEQSFVVQDLPLFLEKLTVFSLLLVERERSLMLALLLGSCLSKQIVRVFE